MKEEFSTSENKATTLSKSPVPGTRARASRTKECPRAEPVNGVSPGLKLRPKPVSPEPNTIPKPGRSILPSKMRPGGDEVGAPGEREMEDPKIVVRTGNRAVEHYARMRRRSDSNFKGVEVDGKTSEWQQRLEASESLVNRLQSEMLMMKAQLERMHSHNLELEAHKKQLTESLLAAQAKISGYERRDQLINQLEAQKKQLTDNLLAAQAKISAYEKRSQVAMTSQESQQSEFEDLRNVIASKLDNLRSKKDVTRQERTVLVQPLVAEPRTRAPETQPKFPVAQPFPPPPPPPPRGLPPPPPPPPSRVAPTGSNAMQKPTALVELYQSLMKRDGKKGPLGNGSSSSPLASNAHNSIVGEIQNRSSHLLAIKADVETKGGFIRDLIEKVNSAAYSDIEDVLNFVGWLDKELSTLADERAVLKHFNWPERKADALREAAFEYRDLKRLALESASFEDDTSMSCEATLKKITTLLDKSERSIQRLVKLRETTMLSYKENKIPVDWMLDSGMVKKIKLASVKLARVYIRRVLTELRSGRHTEKESTHESLIVQGVHFAYRAYQFAGGLDSETMCAFEELRKRAVQSNGRGSRDQLPGITLS
ncbi:protein CHUP1, chloroplastic [Dioscorea cayenensis subsp. rotundata]|uniref:Protein CHUP1, chloroplastic n=1 Tax=Dioscorea cayennensis subsp. rotundata TaxID=55577 RepID=A0AB40BM42_DIOCR|nr:protein CHUP1, chloroplastic [Dioscorea cayenensis subsp. rotundata]XP_039128463.1 protein CHUP1, chloroplastic [Dioscorea cayenensis subsp. rotundata]XP_039128464.1 protein CHUP1, chloroplastic [Dioscorea cayenensis subsp. rotundata]